jgi:AraC-like DNA-binding protein/mannose-6-phosphate isomerase-like protein (cupin superfamily)
MDTRHEVIPFPEDFSFDCYKAKGELSEPLFLHQHDFYEINWVVSGKGINFIDHREYPLQSGDLYTINNREHHIAISDGTLEMYILTFSPDLLGQNDPVAHDYLTPFFAASPRNNRILFNTEETEQVNTLIRSIHGEWEEQKAGYHLLIRARMMELLGRIVRAGENEIPLQSSSEREYEKIRPALVWMNHHFSEALSLDHLAGLTCMSRTYYCDCFKKVMGISSSRYLEIVRVNRACLMLKTGNDPIIEIAARCGYFNVSNFNHAFKRVYSISPREYRKQHKV